MDIDQKIVLRMLEAAQDEQYWKAVLDDLMHVSGSIAAAITLRDKRNCQVIVDDSFELEFHSPFVTGMSTDVVGNYVKRLREKDTWATAQCGNRPYAPLLMSKVLPISELKLTEFGQWAIDQGFNDTVVYQIGKTENFWTALNLYFRNDNDDAAERVLEVVRTYAEPIKRAWALGREIVRHREIEGGILDIASSFGKAVCLISADGKVKSKNSKFDELEVRGLIKVIGPEQRLSIADHVHCSAEFSSVLGKFATHHYFNETGEPFSVSASGVEVDPNYKQKKPSEYILTFKVGIEQIDTQGDENISVLTKQERALFEHVLTGKTIVQAGSEINLKRTRAYEVWDRVKEKTGVSNSHALRG